MVKATRGRYTYYYLLLARNPNPRETIDMPVREKRRERTAGLFVLIGR